MMQKTFVNEETKTELFCAFAIIRLHRDFTQIIISISSFGLNPAAAGTYKN
jgi:hypothetical protein